MSALLPQSSTLAEPTFDARWSRWQADGALRDRGLQRRAVTAAVLIGCGVAAWLALAIYAG